MADTPCPFDLPQPSANVERTGGKHAKNTSWASYLSGSIQFLSTLPTKAIFHTVVDGILNKMMKEGEEDRLTKLFV